MTLRRLVIGSHRHQPISISGGFIHQHIQGCRLGFNGVGRGKLHMLALQGGGIEVESECASEWVVEREVLVVVCVVGVCVLVCVLVVVGGDAAAGKDRS